VKALAAAVLLPVPEDLPPVPLHGGEHANVQGLHEVGGVFRQEAEPDVVLLAQLQDFRRQVGRQVVSNQHLDVLGWQRPDVHQEDLYLQFYLKGIL